MKKILNTNNHSLNWLIQKARKLREFDQQLKAVLDQKLLDHCKVANYQDGCLVICADNPSSATLLRFQVPELIEKLRHQPGLGQLSSIKCQIEIKQEKENIKLADVWPVSEAIITELKASAGSLSNLKLRDSIEQLVKSFEENNDQ